MLARVVSPAVAPKVTSRVTRRAARNIVRAEEEDKSTAIMKVGREKTGLWFASEQSLSYLDGTLPGDFGFDPLGLSDPEGAGGFIDPKWLAYSEVIHCRYAMLGVAGCLAPEVLGQFGAIPEETGLVWFRTGVIPPAGTYDGYWAAPVAVFYVNMVLMQFAELRRLQDYNYPGSMGKQYFLGLEGALGGSGDPTYPGGPIFNFLNLGDTPEKMNNLKLSEVKNGRLAMISIFGYGAQAVMTGKSPVENLADHIADPIHNNMLTNFATAFAQ